MQWIVTQSLLCSSWCPFGQLGHHWSMSCISMFVSMPANILLPEWCWPGWGAHWIWMRRPQVPRCPHRYCQFQRSLYVGLVPEVHQLHQSRWNGHSWDLSCGCLRYSDEPNVPSNCEHSPNSRSDQASGSRFSVRCHLCEHPDVAIGVEVVDHANGIIRF